MSHAMVATPESTIWVLIVDDNQDFATNLSEILRMEGARVVNRPSAGAARDSLRHNRFDVAFLDLRLEDGSGSEVLAELRKSQPDCLSVIMTGNATVQSAIMAVDQGAFAFLLKDMPVEAVLATYRKAREQRILERQKADLERRLRHQDQLALIGQMAATLAHEIRNPLTGIRQAIEVILEVTGEPVGMEGIKNSMLERLRRLNELVNDLLQFGKPVTVEKRAVSLQDLTDSVLAEMKGDGSLRDVEILCRIEPSAASWRIDSQHFRLLLRNIFENAGHAMEKSPRRLMEIHAYLDAEDRLAYEVRDHGHGIAEKNLEQLFRPFFTTRTRGTGLGLALSARIVEEHGGTIAARNAEGGGAVFALHLPR